MKLRKIQYKVKWIERLFPSMFGITFEPNIPYHIRQIILEDARDRCRGLSPIRFKTEKEHRYFMRRCTGLPKPKKKKYLKNK